MNENKFDRNLMSDAEIVLRTKISEFVNRENSYKEFDEQVHEHILGQKNLSEITYNVFMWLRGLAEDCAIRNNAMIIAPSGCGKTETYRVIREILKKEIANIPVVQLDMTKLTAEGFKGMDSDDFFSTLFTDSVNGIAIVLLDEIDKRLIPDRNASGDNVNFSIQSQLLTLIEGTEFTKLIDGEEITIDTRNTLFIGAGAFQCVREKKREKRERNKIGISTTVFQEKNSSKTKMMEDEDLSLRDIIEGGAMYEFMGRFSTIINLHMLDFESIKIITCRYAEEFGRSMKCVIKLSDTFVEEIYKEYFTSGLGCRILKNLLWNRISPMGIEIERNNFVNKGNEIQMICNTVEDVYIVNNQVYRMKKENAA